MMYIIYTAMANSMNGKDALTLPMNIMAPDFIHSPSASLVPLMRGLNKATVAAYNSIAALGSGKKGLANCVFLGAGVPTYKGNFACLGEGKKGVGNVGASTGAKGAVLPPNDKLTVKFYLVKPEYTRSPVPPNLPIPTGTCTYEEVYTLKGAAAVSTPSIPVNFGAVELIMS
jgi:hypothetical protein